METIKKIALFLLWMICFSALNHYITKFFPIIENYISLDYMSGFWLGMIYCVYFIKQKDKTNEL